MTPPSGPDVIPGSAALWLRGENIAVGDADLVIEPGERAVGRLCEALAHIAVAPVPSSRRFPETSVIGVGTAYGHIDCLLERGRRDWAALRGGAGWLPVADVPVLVAASADAWRLRRRYRGRGQ